MKLVEVILAGILSCALFMVLHAINWRRFFGGRPQPPWSYVAGIAGLAVPFTALMALWRDGWALAGAASVVVGGGASVIYGYHVRSIACRDGLAGDLTVEECQAIMSVQQKEIGKLHKQLTAERRKCRDKRNGRPAA